MLQWLLIGIIAFLVFKDKKGSALIKSFGKAKEEFRKGREGIEEEIIYEGKPTIKVIKKEEQS